MNDDLKRMKKSLTNAEFQDMIYNSPKVLNYSRYDMSFITDIQVENKLLIKGWKDDMINDLQVGKVYKIKEYNSRPAGWNGAGEMDEYMGQKVRIKEIIQGQIVIHNDSRHYGHWFFTADNFEQDYTLDDNLFEM